MDVKSVLRSAAGKSQSKPSTDMVEIPLPSGLLAKHRELYNAAKAAKADLALSEEELLDEVKTQYVDAVKKHYVNSARLTGDGVRATVSWKDAYTKIPVDQKDELKKLVGEKYNDYFKDINDIAVKPDIASDENSLAELIEAVGPETFAKYFDVSQYIKPTSKFTQERHREFTDKTNNELNVTVKQYKPAVRIK